MKSAIAILAISMAEAKHAHHHHSYEQDEDHESIAHFATKQIALAVSKDGLDDGQLLTEIQYNLDKG